MVANRREDWPFEPASRAGAARGALRLEAALMGAAAMADMAADILRRTTTSGLGARLHGQWTGRGACVYEYKNQRL